MPCFLGSMKYNHKGKRDYVEKGKHFLSWLPTKMGEVILWGTFYNDLRLCTVLLFPYLQTYTLWGENKTFRNVYIPEARPARKAAPRLDISVFAGFSIFLLIKSEVICITKLLLLTPPSALQERGIKGKKKKKQKPTCLVQTLTANISDTYA